MILMLILKKIFLTQMYYLIHYSTYFLNILLNFIYSVCKYFLKTIILNLIQIIQFNICKRVSTNETRLYELKANKVRAFRDA